MITDGYCEALIGYRGRDRTKHKHCAAIRQHSTSDARTTLLSDHGVDPSGSFLRGHPAQEFQVWIDPRHRAARSGYSRQRVNELTLIDVSIGYAELALII